MVSPETLKAVVEAHGALTALLVKSPGDALLTEALRLADDILVDLKGDVAGHGFHGNRYTGGIGGAPNVTPADAVLALRRYTGGAYAAINDKLRGIPPDPMTLKEDEQYRDDVRDADKYTATLDAMLTPLPATTVFRGISGSGIAALLGLDGLIDPENRENLTVSEEEFDRQVAEALPDLVGTGFKDGGFCSTSKAEYVGEQRTAFTGSGHVEMQIEVPAGIKGLDMNEAFKAQGQENAFASEKEVLLEHGLTFRIDGVSERQGLTPFSLNPASITTTEASWKVHVLHVTVVKA